MVITIQEYIDQLFSGRSREEVLVNITPFYVYEIERNPE